MTLQQVLSHRGVPYRLGGDRLKIHLCCPFCVERGKESDSKFRLCVHATQGWGRCLHCDWKRKTAVFAVLAALGVKDNITGFEREEVQKYGPPRLPDDFQKLSKPQDDLDREARRYLLKRGITPQQIRENRLGVSYLGRYAYRILFPVYKDKKLVGINARDFTGRQKPKYLNSLGDKYLFHFNPEAEVCILSEGAFKALRIEQVTEYNSASVLGHDLTDSMLEQIKTSSCKTIILYPDPDPVGRKGMITVADKLREKWNGEVRIVWPVALPADEEDLEVMRKLIINSAPYRWEFRIKLLLNK